MAAAKRPKHDVPIISTWETTNQPSSQTHLSKYKQAILDVLEKQLIETDSVTDRKKIIACTAMLYVMDDNLVERYLKSWTAESFYRQLSDAALSVTNDCK
jgi:hypothetical protein